MIPKCYMFLTHAYSDLSTRAAQELARTAPNSIPALEMDADANEVQGKWDQAEKDYRKILEQNPHYPGIHFRLARLLLSKPNPAPDFAEQAKKELQQELEIDPANAGAEYMLGELARQARTYPKRCSISPRPLSWIRILPMPISGWACRYWPKRNIPRQLLRWKWQSNCSLGIPPGTTAWRRHTRAPDEKKMRSGN